MLAGCLVRQRRTHASSHVARTPGVSNRGLLLAFPHVSHAAVQRLCVLMLQRAGNRLVSRATPAVCVAVVDTAQRALAHSASWDLLCTWDQDDDGTCVTAVRYVLRPRHPVPMKFMCSSLACWLVMCVGAVQLTYDAAKRSG